MKKSSNSKDVVQARSKWFRYVLGQSLMEQLSHKSDRRRSDGRFLVRAELRKTLVEFLPTVNTYRRDILNVTSFNVTNDLSLSIGCHHFNRKDSAKIRKWCGL